MRVNQPGNNPVQNTDVAGAKSSARAAAAKQSKLGGKPGEATAVPAGTAEISSRGKELASAKAAATRAPDVREERIAELKKRIEAGQYQVDAKKVADRMVDDHLSTGIG